MNTVAAVQPLELPPHLFPPHPLGAKVLAVEDEDDHFALLSLQLAEETPRITAIRAQSLAEARRFAGTDMFDAVMLDLDLPDSTGLDTLAALRETFPDIPLVVLSSHDDTRLGVEAIQCGADDYIDKGSICTAGLARRITFARERFDAQRGLRRRGDMLRTMVAMLGHDLRTPPRQINVLCGMIETVLDKDALHAVADHIDGVRSRCTHLRTLLDVTMDYAVNAAKEPDKSVHLLSQVMESVAADLDPESRRRVTLARDAMIFADPALMFHILRNIVGNGLAYWQAVPSRVTVGATTENGWTRITVSDTGMGIPAPLQKRIFQPNTRGADARQHPGTGFGLSIARILVEAHGGEIGLTSAPGRGTSFTITLPFTKPALPAAHPEA